LQMRLPYAALAVLMLGLARPSWGVGLELVIEGREAELAGRRDAALTAYGEAAKAGDLTNAQKAYVYSRMGSIRGYLGENIKAISDYTKAVELDAKLGRAYSLRGYLRGAVGQYDLAEKDHQAAVALAKDQKSDDYLPWVLQHYADLWRRRGDFARALKYCDQADRAKKSPAVAFRRAWIYLDMGKAAEAKAEFQRFMKESQGVDFRVFWPDERGAISRLQELRANEP
ncbi:MAG: tetratricopeptide repeat protein, partial [Nevskiaceae bacterium]